MVCTDMYITQSFSFIVLLPVRIVSTVLAIRLAVEVMAPTKIGI